MFWIGTIAECHTDFYKYFRTRKSISRAERSAVFSWLQSYCEYKPRMRICKHYFSEQAPKVQAAISVHLPVTTGRLTAKQNQEPKLKSTNGVRISRYDEKNLKSYATLFNYGIRLKTKEYVRKTLRSTKYEALTSFCPKSRSVEVHDRIARLLVNRTIRISKDSRRFWNVSLFAINVNSRQNVDS